MNLVRVASSNRIQYSCTLALSSTVVIRQSLVEGVATGSALVLPVLASAGLFGGAPLSPARGGATDAVLGGGTGAFPAERADLLFRVAVDETGGSTPPAVIGWDCMGCLPAARELGAGCAIALGLF